MKEKNLTVEIIFNDFESDRYNKKQEARKFELEHSGYKLSRKVFCGEHKVKLIYKKGEEDEIKPTNKEK
tara:strand:- start:233 stop:439 length:207 start_codon:yes stop_codon:yes gene_type:complete